MCIQEFLWAVIVDNVWDISFLIKIWGTNEIINLYRCGYRLIQNQQVEVRENGRFVKTEIQVSDIFAGSVVCEKIEELGIQTWFQVERELGVR